MLHILLAGLLIKVKKNWGGKCVTLKSTRASVYCLAVCKVSKIAEVLLEVTKLSTGVEPCKEQMRQNMGR